MYGSEGQQAACKAAIGRSEKELVEQVGAVADDVDESSAAFKGFYVSHA